MEVIVIIINHHEHHHHLIIIMTQQKKSTAHYTCIMFFFYTYSAYDPRDTIIPPKSGEVDPPDVFPRTIQALTGLNDVDLLSRMEEYYALSHRGVLKARIRRVLRAYGIGVTIDTRVIY